MCLDFIMHVLNEISEFSKPLISYVNKCENKYILFLCIVVRQFVLTIVIIRIIYLRYIILTLRRKVVICIILT